MNDLYNTNSDYLDMISSGRGFQTKSISMSVSSIIEQINNDRIDLQLDFKTKNQWPVLKASKLIESVLVGFPLQNIFCEESRYGNILLLDGAQIINSLHRFHRGNFSLQGLSIRKDLNGKKIYDLDYRDYSLLMDRYLINIIIIGYDSDNLLKYEFCKRVNSNNSLFPIQNARNYAYPDMKNAIMLLKNNVYNIISFKVNYPDSKRNITKNKINAEVDQFFLYLFMLAFLQFNLIHPYDDSTTISEALDISANYYENNRQARGVDNYIFKKIQGMLNVLNYDFMMIVIEPTSITKLSNSELFHPVLDDDEVINANTFIHLFYNFLMNDNIPKRSLLKIKKDKKTPSYLDVKSLFTSIF